MASNNEDIVSASQDGKLLIWNTSTTNKKIAIPLRSAWVMTCAYSPSLTYVASGGLDNLCTIFNVKDSIGWDVNQPYRELQRHEGYLSCCRFKDNNQIITSSGDASCILWDIDKQSALQSFVDHNGDVESVAICPNNENIFISGSIDAMAKVCDIRQGNNAIANFKGHESDINSVEWFPDGNAFISGSDDTTVRLFDLTAYKQLNIYCGDDILASVTSIGFSNSGYYLLVGYDEEPFCLAWNTMTADREAQLEHPTRTSCLQVYPMLIQLKRLEDVAPTYIIHRSFMQFQKLEKIPNLINKINSGGYNRDRGDGYNRDRNRGRDRNRDRDRDRGRDRDMCRDGNRGRDRDRDRDRGRDRDRCRDRNRDRDKTTSFSCI